MKNRTIIGIICMVLAVVITFAAAPLVNRLTSDTTTVVRLILLPIIFVKMFLLSIIWYRII